MPTPRPLRCTPLLGASLLPVALLPVAALTVALLALTACGGSQPHRTLARPPASPPAARTTPTAPTSGPTTPAQAQAQATAAQAGQRAAATASAKGTLPLDPRVRTGKLANGLTYYILPHKKPEKRALLWLAVNAGSVLEDADQRGLAHFLEHMAFNGTKRFKKLAIVNFIERIGMRFGADLNAYTSFDQTVYQLQVPTDDSKLLDQGFKILFDWAHAIAFEPEEVEAERGVVLEEWRKGLGAQKRVLNQQLPVLLKGSRYAERLPIGLPKIIKTAPRSALTRFYQDWYRPELMAVVVVGDIDPADIERRIQGTFIGLKNPAKARKRTVFTVPAHAETLVTTTLDKELSRTIIQLVHKMPHRAMLTAADYRRAVLERLYAAMLNERFAELRVRPNAPFLGAFAGMAKWVRTMDAFVLYAAVKADQVAQGVKALGWEVARVNRHGFSTAELKRAKVKMLRQVQRAVAMREKQPSKAFAKEVLRYHFGKEAMPGVERELALTKAVLATVQLKDVNDLARGWIKPANRVIAISAPSGTKLPSDAELIALAGPNYDTQIPNWHATKDLPPLLATPPKPGKIVAEAQLPKLGVTVWTLSNGAKVWLKPTQFKNDEVRFHAFAAGGTSLASDADFPSAKYAAKLMAQSGVGQLSRTQLGYVLAGKIAHVQPYIDELSQGLRGSASPKDLETLMQLAYQRFRAPRQDNKAFAAWQAQQAEALKNRARSPRRVFFDTFTRRVSKDHPRRRPPSLAELQQVDLGKALAFYQQRFSNAADFSFVFVGNTDAATLKPLVERYIASLPGRKRPRPTTWRDPHIHRLNQGEITVRKGVEPTAFVLVYFTLPTAWSLDAEDDAAMLSAALRIRLREVLREKMSGVYGVGARSSVTRWPESRATSFVAFGCAPENVPALKAAVLKVIEEVQHNGVSDEIVAKLKALRKRQYEVKLKQNGFWLSQLKRHLWYKTDPARILATEARVKRVNSAQIKAAAKRFLTPKRYVFGQLLPENQTPVQPVGQQLQ